MAELIICDASNPGPTDGHYRIPYNEAVDGYLHAYFVDSRNPGKRGVRYSRTPGHPQDPRCPACRPEVTHG